MIPDFAQSYLAMQGVILMPPCRKASRVIGERVPENVPRVPEYERGI